MPNMPHNFIRVDNSIVMLTILPLLVLFSLTDNAPTIYNADLLGSEFVITFYVMIL